MSIENASQAVLMWPLLHVVRVKRVQISLYSSPVPPSPSGGYAHPVPKGTSPHQRDGGIPHWQGCPIGKLGKDCVPPPPERWEYSHQDGWGYLPPC